MRKSSHRQHCTLGIQEVYMKFSCCHSCWFIIQQPCLKLIFPTIEGTTYVKEKNKPLIKIQIKCKENGDNTKAVSGCQGNSIEWSVLMRQSCFSLFRGQRCAQVINKNTIFLLDFKPCHLENCVHYAASYFYFSQSVNNISYISSPLLSQSELRDMLLKIRKY